jgi:hypothetical protein
MPKRGGGGPPDFLRDVLRTNSANRICKVSRHRLLMYSSLSRIWLRVPRHHIIIILSFIITTSIAM